jgi:hypothetical protein
MKRLLTAVLMGSLMFSAAGCKKKEEKPQMPAGHPSMQGDGMPQTGMPDMPKVDRAVVVPPAVKAKWKAVKLNIEDKTAQTSKEHTVSVGSELNIPNTQVNVKILAFLPDFRMAEKEITSASDKPNNPAVQVSVQEAGKEVWRGWLYSMHPAIHPFTHEKVGITLVSGVSK